MMRAIGKSIATLETAPLIHPIVRDDSLLINNVLHQIDLKENL